MQTQEMWIKIGLIGSNFIVDTLQGRIGLESFGNIHTVGDIDLTARLNDGVESGKSFKLFDPIKLQLTAQGIGATAIAKAHKDASTPLPVSTDYININPRAIAWWAPLEKSEDWTRIVSGTIHGIEVASDVPPDIQGSFGPRLVR
jgi:hypothetical protein